MKKIKYILIALLAVGSYLLGQEIGSRAAVNKEIEIVEVEKVLWREHSVTRIVESPDGTKETIIDTRKESDTTRNTETKEKVSTYRPQWSVRATGNFSDERIYSFGVDRRILGGLFVGLYGRTDSEFGLSLRYEF